MDWKRLQEPTFVVAALNGVLLISLLGTTAFRSPPPPPAESRELLSKLEHLQESIKTTESRLSGMEATLASLHEAIGPREPASGAAIGETLELHSKDDAVKLIATLGELPSAEGLAECLAVIDGWICEPADADALQMFKMDQITVLRKLVKTEVNLLHEQALKAETGAKSAELHAKASQILALYPMDSSKAVLDEARTLSSDHSEVGVRIDVIRRQRYNAWAMTRIEDTIKAINSTASSFRTSDNPQTIEATVKRLGEVDPLLLEPTVAQLYNYAVEQAKSNVSSEQQLELGRRMIDPAIKRRGYGDL